jgi:hypothetical protein
MGAAVGWARRGETIDGIPLRAATLDESATGVGATNRLGVTTMVDECAVRSPSKDAYGQGRGGHGQVSHHSQLI